MTDNADAASDAAESFWRFALDFYARPGVSPACLELQDRHGKDVIIALFACWIGASGRGSLDEAGLAAAEARARPWRQQVVEPLRRARHGLKGVAGAEPLYAKMKEIELDAERVAIRRLAALGPTPDQSLPAAERDAAARGNLERYLGPEPLSAAAPLLAALGPA